MSTTATETVSPKPDKETNGHAAAEYINSWTKDDTETVTFGSRSVGFWLSLALAGLVWSITPIAWIVVVKVMLSSKKIQDYHGVSRFFIYYFFAEVPFSLFYQWLARKAQVIKPEPEFDAGKMKFLLRECLDVGMRQDTHGETETSEDGVSDRGAAHFRKKTRMWFYNAALSDIKHDNVKEWLAWALVSAPLEDAIKDKQKDELLEQGVQWVEERIKAKMSPGYNPKVRCIRLTLDRVKVHNRPLGYYVVCNGATIITQAWLMLVHGFRLETRRGCHFMVRPAPKAGSKHKYPRKCKLPIIFLHGLGIGLAQYVAFLRELVQCDQTVIILVQPAISTFIWHPRFLNPPSPTEHAKAINEVANGLGFDKATILSHSNGTMVHGWLLRYRSELCARNILVDPVCFRLWEGGK